MLLPVLHASIHDADDLVRQCHKALAMWSDHVAQSTAMPWGTVYAERDCADPAARCVLDLSLAGEGRAEQVIEEAERCFAERGCAVARWLPAPGEPQASRDALRQELARRGWHAHDLVVMRAQAQPQVRAEPWLSVVSARAALAVYARLSADMQRPDPQAELLHLDDSRYDALLALHDRQPVGAAGILAVGQSGVIMRLHTLTHHQRRGVGRRLLSGLLDIAARALYRQVLAVVDARQSAGQALLSAMGFVEVARFVIHQREGDPGI